MAHKRSRYAGLKKAASTPSGKPKVEKNVKADTRSYRASNYNGSANRAYTRSAAYADGCKRRGKTLDPATLIDRTYASKPIPSAGPLTVDDHPGVTGKGTRPWFARTERERIASPFLNPLS